MFARTFTLVRRTMQSQPATIIEIRSFRNAWQVYEAPGVQPVFLTKEQAMSYAQSRVCFAPGRFAFSIQTALLSVQFRSARQTENCDAGNSAGQPSAATD